MDEQKVINALKEVRNYCLIIEHCSECYFSSRTGCKISDSICSDWSPSGFEIEELEKSVNPK
jgi:hypothetical protein